MTKKDFPVGTRVVFCQSETYYHGEVCPPFEYETKEATYVNVRFDTFGQNIWPYNYDGVSPHMLQLERDFEDRQMAPLIARMKEIMES